LPYAERGDKRSVPAGTEPGSIPEFPWPVLNPSG
jgi:hypothetical protein